MNVKHAILLIYILCLQSYSTVVVAQLSNDKKLTQYILRNYTTEQGLQSNTLLNLARTNDGFIWASSYDGLARFDGREFKIYNTRNLPGLLSNSISSIIVTKENELLMGTRGKGAYVFKNNKVRLIHPSLFDSFVTSLYQASDGSIWVGTSAEGVYVVKNKGIKFIPIEGHISGIVEVKPDEFWIATHTEGVVILKSGKLAASLKKDNGLRDNYVNSLTMHNNKVYVCNQSGLNVVDPATFAVQSYSELNGIETYNVKFDSLENLWIATIQGIYRKIKDTPFEVLNEHNGLENEDVRDVLFDWEGNAWFATYRAGLFQLLDGKFTNYNTSEGFSSSSVRSVFEWKTKHLMLFGFETGEIDQLKNGVITKFPLKNKLTKAVYDFKTDSEGNLWIASHNGLIKRDSLGNEKLFTTDNGLTSNLLRCLFFDKHGQLWIGTRDKGLMVMKDENIIKTYSVSDFLLGSDLILSIRDNASGDVIVGTNTAGFYILRDGFEIQQYASKNGLKSNIVFNVYPDKDKVGKYWAATGFGLTMIDGDTIASFRYNSSNTEMSFFDVVEDDLGYFWLPCPLGVLRVSKNELNASSRDSTKTVNWKLYGHQDGIKSPQCLGASRSLRTSKGEIWIPASKGLTTIHPNGIKQVNWKPPVT